MIQYNIRKKNRFIQEDNYKIIIKFNLNCKISQKGCKEEIHFYNNRQEKGRYFIQKDNLIYSD